MTRNLLITAIIAVTAAPLMAQDTANATAAAKVTVTPYTVRETREVKLVKDTGPNFGQGGFLTVTLLLQGKPVEEATHWGMIHFTSVVDDQGNSLAPRTGSGPIALNDYEELNREHMWFFQDVKPKDKIKVDIPLSPAPRSATKIATMTGTLKLNQVQAKDVIVADLDKLVGKNVADKTLAAAGITVKISKFQRRKGSGEVELKVTDPNKMLQDADLVDANGKKLSNFSSSFGFNNTKTISMGAGDTLPADTRVKLSIKTGQKEVVVPFKITNLALP